MRIGHSLATLLGALTCCSAYASFVAGPPTTTIPGALYDPLSSLAVPLPANEFLVPINVFGAVDLQDWLFDLSFTASVAAPIDGGGLYQSVYQAYFDGSTDLSEVTSSGFLLPGQLEGVAGFSSSVNGDGTIAYVLFEYLAAQEGKDPGVRVDSPINAIPEPSTMALSLLSFMAMGATALRGARRTESRA